MLKEESRFEMAKHSQAGFGHASGLLGLWEGTARGQGPNKVLILSAEQKILLALTTTEVGSNPVKGLVVSIHYKFPRLYSLSMLVLSFIHPLFHQLLNRMYQALCAML